MTKKPHIVFLLGLLFCTFQLSAVYGQLSDREIKLSGNYYWGQGYGEQREGAISNAKRDLIEKMMVRIEAESRFSERDTNDEYFVELQTSTKSTTRIELKGLNYLPAEQRRDGTWQTVAYLSKTDFNNTIDDAEKQLLSSLVQAQTDERNGNINEAIPVYMDLLASTYFYPVSFYTKPDIDGNQHELRSYLNRKLSSWLNSITWEVAEIRNLSTNTNTEFYFDLEFRYNNQPSSNLLAHLNKPGYPIHSVQNGRSTIFYDYKPDELIERYSLKLDPEIYPVIEEDKQAILADILPQRQIEIEIDFSDIINLDISLNTSDSKTWLLVPEIKNLSVFDVQWEFKGVTITSNTLQVNAAILHTDTPVLLTLNGSDDLTVLRILTPNGSLVEPTQPDENTELLADQQTLILESQDAIFEIPGDKSEYIKQILSYKNAVSLTQYLNRLKTRGVLKAVGTKSSMPDSTLSYLAIIKPQNRAVDTILSPIVDGYRTNLNTEETIEDYLLATTFEGMGSVWFQFN